MWNIQTELPESEAALPVIAGRAIMGNGPASSWQQPFSMTGAAMLEGLLLGGACGDALGAAVEFDSRARILAQYGPDGIRDFAPAYGRAGAITDDTQMTLFTVEGLLDAAERVPDAGLWATDVHAAYHRWYRTQQGAFPGAQPTVRPLWLANCADLWSRRAPGTTCLAAFDRRAFALGRAASNDSKGAGGIMRVAPVGLLTIDDPFALGAATARLTHGHPTGWVAAGAFALFIAALADGLDAGAAGAQALADVQERAAQIEPDDPARLGYEETIRAMESGLATPADAAEPRVLACLGEGWVAEEALAMTLWVLRTPLGPVDMLPLSVNITGDSDTLGCMVGQALGVRHGTAWIPTRWLESLELVDTMRALARMAAAALPLRAGGPGPLPSGGGSRD